MQAVRRDGKHLEGFVISTSLSTDAVDIFVYNICRQSVYTECRLRMSMCTVCRHLTCKRLWPLSLRNPARVRYQSQVFWKQCCRLPKRSVPQAPDSAAGEALPRSRAVHTSSHDFRSRGVPRSVVAVAPVRDLVTLARQPLRILESHLAR